MRNTHQLLTILLSRFNNRIYDNTLSEFNMGETLIPCGLCLVLWNLRDKGLITHDEKVHLGEYIDNNGPEGFDRLEKSYWFEPGEIEQRRSWLNQHLILTKWLETET